MPNWRDEQIDQLKSLWAEGLSGSQIARVIGSGHTRNSVISKVHRLGLTARAGERRSVPSAPRAHAPGPPRTNGHSLPALLPRVPPRPLLWPDGSRVTIESVGDDMCRWPIGDPRSVDFHFCGRQPLVGSRYCEFHKRLSVDPAQPSPARPWRD